MNDVVESVSRHLVVRPASARVLSACASDVMIV